jgi:anti-sigma regulatory factor (Ser/Thr protein kinase)
LNSPAAGLRSAEAFRHEAFFYAGEDEFLDGSTAFIRGAVEAGEPIFVVVSARRIDLLRDRLASDVGAVRFADMGEVGTNPARIIPAWAEFVHECGGQNARGIGEPIWSERSVAELAECQRHESLLNVAFAESPGFTLMCPYDSDSLGRDVVDEAFRSHPFIRRGDALSASPEFLGCEELGRPFATPLPAPPGTTTDLVFQARSLRDLRSLVLREARRARLSGTRADDVVTAVHEVASNSLRHAGGLGVLRMWHTEDSLICEVSDDGHIQDPLVGRRRPAVGDRGGRGLWMVNQLCDLVQVRSMSEGTTVRMHFRCGQGG